MTEAPCSEECFRGFYAELNDLKMRGEDELIDELFTMLIEAMFEKPPHKQEQKKRGILSKLGSFFRRR